MMSQMRRSYSKKKKLLIYLFYMEKRIRLISTSVKLQVVKTLKEFYDIPLKDAKDIVDSIPTTLPLVDENWKLKSLEMQLLSLGCKIEVLNANNTPIHNNIQTVNPMNHVNELKRSTPTTPTSAPESSFDKMLYEYMGEIQRVESELNQQLYEIGKKIDAGFTQMANLVETVTDFAVNVSQGLISNENRGKIVFWGDVASKAIQTIGAVRNAYQHNKALDKLLVQKQAIASAKRASLQRILPKIEKVHNQLEKIVVAEGKKSYELSKLEDSSIRDLLFNNMDKKLAAYRAAEYVSLTSEYLMAEYNAWLDGDQRSSIPRPTYLDVNQNIVSLLAPGDNNNTRKISSTLGSSPSTLQGSTLYFLHDTSLTSVLLLGEGMVPDEENPGEDTFVTQEVPQIQSDVIGDIISTNEAFQSFKQSALDYKEIKDGDYSGMIGCLGTIVSIGGTWALFHFFLNDWATWIQWVVGIIIAGILFSIFVSIQSNIENKVKDKLNAINQDNFDDLIEKTGYVEIQEPDVEKKSVVGTAVSGLLDMVGGAEGIMNITNNFLRKR